MEELIYYNELFDLYGLLLTDVEQDIFKNYYQENYTLSEIAEYKGISRSAISKTLNKVIEKLNYYEEKTNIYAKNKKIIDLLADDKTMQEKVIDIMKGKVI